MKKSFSRTAVFLLLAFLIMAGAGSAQAAKVQTKSRLIHIVYDDSGSMKSVNGVPKTRWSQAKYAMEVFAAMMGPSDTLTIYPMTAFSYLNADKVPSGNFGQTVTISGSADSAERVSAVMQMNGDGGRYLNTPLQSVEQAAEDLIAAQADDKWLIILTDGAFDNGIDGEYYDRSVVEETLMSYAERDDFSMYYIGIDLDGDGEEEAAGGDEKKVDPVDLSGKKGIDGFYPESVEADNILETITEAARTVFNLQSIECSGTEPLRFEADIPISKVVIFAQGDGVEVAPLEYGGAAVDAGSSSVQVSVTPADGYAPDGAVYAEDLRGAVVTYLAEDETKPMAGGSYSFSTNAKNTAVYYEPGVAVRAVLTNKAGDTYDIAMEGEQVLPAGDWKVELQVYDPLTGEVIDKGSSELLGDPQVSLLVLREGEEEPQILTDGDTFTLEEGNVTLQSVIDFPGDIEKRSEEKGLEVTSLDLALSFGEESYSYDPVTGKWSGKIKAKVTDAEGGALPEELLQNLKVSTEKLDGFTCEWSAGSGGAIELAITPADPDAGPGSLPLGEQTLDMNVSIPYAGLEKTGSAQTKLEIGTDAQLELVFTLSVEEKQASSGSGYQFDPDVLGPQKDASYILAEVGMKEPDGSVRPLTAEEFALVEDKLHISSNAQDKNFLRTITAIFCRQSLQFATVPDAASSSFKLYLDGPGRTRVRPNTSEVKVSAKASLENGLVMKGSGTCPVTVRSLPWYIYFLPAIITFAVTLLILTIIVMEIRKPRLPRNMYPVTYAVLKENGTPMDPALLPRPQFGGMKMRFRIFPPWKAEERQIMMRYGAYLSPIYFTCVATGHGGFKIADVTPFQKVEKDVDFQGRSYSMMRTRPATFSTGSLIRVFINDDDVKGQVIMKFRR